MVSLGSDLTKQARCWNLRALLLGSVFLTMDFQCKDCKRAKNRTYVENHRKRIMDERALFLAERDYERKRNFELQGQVDLVMRLSA